MPNRLKLREIAALANVSPAAVSLVYKGRPGVGSQKRKEISDLLIQNGYAVSSAVSARAREHPVNKIYQALLPGRRQHGLCQRNHRFCGTGLQAFGI